MEEYNDDDNTSIVVRARERSKVCFSRSRFAQNKISAYLLKDLMLCVRQGVQTYSLGFILLYEGKC